MAGLNVKILEASFDLPIFQKQVPLWRGAFIEWSSGQNIFHNHAYGGRVYHRYPLVQYRSLNGKASILAVNEGVEAMTDLLQSPREWKIRWNNTPTILRMEHMRMDSENLDLMGEPREYRLIRWLALNTENYNRWNQLQTFRERVELLDRILAANLLSLCSGLKWLIPHRFEAHLTLIENIKLVTIHGHQFMAFDCSFISDLSIPIGLGLGKSASHGFGVLLQNERI